MRSWRKPTSASVYKNPLHVARPFADREAIFDYIEQHSPQGALNVMRAIEKLIAQLEHFPYSAPATDEPDL